MEGGGGGCGGDLDGQQPLPDGDDGEAFGVKRQNPLTSSTTFLQWAISLPRWILRSRTAFSWCLRTSFTAKWQRKPLPTTCLPLPAPHPGCFASSGSKLNRRQLRRVAFQRLLHVWTLVINYMYLGRFPTMAELGRTPNPWQLRCFQRLRALLHVCGSSPGDIPLIPGRSGFEFGAGLFQLEQFMAKTPELLDPYGAPPTAKMKFDKTINTVSDFPQLEPYKSLDADRLKLVGCGKWPMEKFLRGVLWLPFQEPLFLLHGQDTTGAALPDFKFEDPSENLRLARIWDQRGLLHLAAQPLRPGHHSRVFNAFKNAMQDRQIGDRRIPNSREFRLDGPSKNLPPGSLLCGISVPRFTHQLLGSITDRRDYYHQAQVSDSRACSNMLPFCYPAEAFSDLDALKTWQESEKGKRRADRYEVGDGFEAAEGGSTFARGGGRPGFLFPCFRSLFQGDHLGVEFALRSHEVLLQDADLLLPGRRLLGHHMVPGGGRWEALIIDDYFCIGAEPVGQSPLNSFASAALAKARAAYEKHGLEGSVEKDIEAQPIFKAAGAEIISTLEACRLGVASVAAPMAKRIALSSLTLRMASFPMTSPRLAARLAGNWVSVLLYRRCLSSLVDDFFALGAGCEEMPANMLVPLSRKVSQELVMLAAMAPLACSNVALPTAPLVYATDASMAKGAVCEAALDVEFARELWLGGDRKGGYSRLDHGFAAALHAAGEETFGETEAEEPLRRGPYKSPLLYFDFVEFYGGSGTISSCMAELGFVTAPPLDLSLSKHFDMGDCRLLEWCVYMLEENRFKSFVTEPPCTSFSAAAHPAVRSYARPLGYNRLERKTWFGNLHAFRSIVLLRVGRRCRRPCGAEQPFLSKMAWLTSWRALLEIDFHEIFLASCQFGSPHKKQFRFIVYGLDHEEMTVKCPGGHAHIPIQGAYTKPSAIYVRGLAMHVARFFQRALVRSKNLEVEEPKVDGLESVVANDLLLSKPWELTKVWSWKKKDRRHINVLEGDAAVKMLEDAARRWEDHRINSLIDSRVAKCALAKGRSSSRALQGICRRAAAVQISGGLYPSWGFAPTRYNTADCPTRDMDFPGLCRSITSHLSLDQIRSLQIPQLSRAGSNWLRLVLLLSMFITADATPSALTAPFGLSLSILCVFHTFWTFALFPALAACSILGLYLVTSATSTSSGQPRLRKFPNVCWPGKLGPLLVVWFLLAAPLSHGMPLGPQTSAELGRAEKRAAAHLQATRVVRKQTLDSREKLLNEFGSWLWEERSIRLATLLQKKPPDPEELCALLVAYGQEMFAAGRSYGRYAETINSIAAARPLIKKQLTAAWDLAFCWLSDEPHQHHPAMPRSVLLAACSLSLMWGWPYVASVLCIGWSGIMRIGEVIMARRSDLVLPCDSAPGLRCILVKIRTPKTRGRSAKHQSARIDPCDLVRLITAVYKNFDEEQQIWPYSPSTLRKRFASLMQVLGLDVVRSMNQAPFDLGSLRPGGATDLLFETEDSELVRRRGRWLSARVMEIYLQEVLASTYVSRLPLDVQERIEKLALVFPEVLERAVSFLSTWIPPLVWYQLFQAHST